MRAAKVLERVLLTIPIMLGVATMVFIFMRLTPGDPVDIMMGEMVGISDAEMEAMRREFNLDKPIHVQLWLFLVGILRGDLGTGSTRFSIGPVWPGRSWASPCPPSGWAWS